MASGITLTLLSVDIPLPVEAVPADKLEALIDKAWQTAKAPVTALARAAGGKVEAFKAAGAAADLKALSGRLGFDFYVAYSDNAVGAYWTERKRSIRVLTETKVPVDVEKKRAFLASLNGWSHGGKKLVSDADLKKYEADFPLKPKVYKSFAEMQKKDRNAVLAFRSWALGKGGKPGKAYGDVLDTQNLDEKDPARVKALKAIDETLKEYYKSF